MAHARATDAAKSIEALSLTADAQFFQEREFEILRVDRWCGAVPERREELILACH